MTYEKRNLCGFGQRIAFYQFVYGVVMFKISIVDSPSKRKLFVEGTLVTPWTTELENVWRGAGQNLDGRKLVIDLSNVTVISQEGENTLLELMRSGAKFSCGGVLTKYVLGRLARKCQSKLRNVLNLTGTREDQA
jgi:hypothetical protein